MNADRQVGETVDGSRSMRFIAWLAVIVVVVTSAIIHGWIPIGRPWAGGFSDSIDYLILAQYFHDWFVGERSPMLTEFFERSRFPPLYPFLVMLAGGGYSATQPAYWFTAATAVASVVLSIAWYRVALGDRLAAALLVVPVVLCPTYFLLALNPVSEPLFVCLLLSTLLLAPRITASRMSLLAFLLCAGLVPLCRTAGLAMTLVAIVPIVRAASHPRGMRVVALVLLATPIAAWMAYRSQLPVVGSYGQNFDLARILATFGGWSGWLVDHPLRILDGFGAMLHPFDGAVTSSVGIVLVALALLGWFERVRTLALDALFMPVYLGLVFVWPHPAEVPRLVVVTLPVVLLCAWQGIDRMITRRIAPGPPRARAVSAVVAMIALALVAPFALRAVARVSMPVATELAPFKRSPSFFTIEDDARAPKVLTLAALTKAAVEALPEYVPANDCVNTFHAAMVGFYTNGRVRIVETPYPPDTRLPLHERFGGCRYVLVLSTTSPQLGQPGLYPLRELVGHSKPQFMSTIETDAGRAPAAVLLQLVNPLAGESGAVTPGAAALPAPLPQPPESASSN